MSANRKNSEFSRAIGFVMLGLMTLVTRSAVAEVPLPWEQKASSVTQQQPTVPEWSQPQAQGLQSSPSNGSSVVTANYQAEEQNKQLPSTPQILPVAAEQLSTEPPVNDQPSPLSRQLRRPESALASLGEGDAETSRSSGGLSSLLWTLGIVVVLSFGFIFGVQLYVKRQPGGGNRLPNEAVELLGRRSVDPRHAVQLIRCGSRILVVGLSADGMRTLAEINDPVEVDALAGICKAGTISGNAETLFQQVFQKQWGSQEKTAEAAEQTPPEPRIADLANDQAGISRQQAVELSEELEKRFRQQQGNRYA